MVKRIALVALCFFEVLLVTAQNKSEKLPDNWFNLDLSTSGYFGISVEKAYAELLKDKKPKEKIIVAVIDAGIDINHEDLKDVLWTNPKEIPDNGIDDDKNGYVDDIHGWNFIGSKKGDLSYDNLEMVRIKRKYEPKYHSTITSTVLDSIQKNEYQLYLKAVADFGKEYDEASSAFSTYVAIKKMLDSVARINKKEIPSLEDISRYEANDEAEEQLKKIIHKGAKKEGGIEKFYRSITKGCRKLDILLKYNLNEKYDQRAELVGDNYEDSYQKDYGNNNVIGPNPEHGTHVSGIIGANRNNNIGIMGIANNVSIMAVRVVPEGDERDKDVANGIRYAVDNGARIINMSFGKAYKWDKKAVDSAVKYAEKKGVLLIHAAGNDNRNNDLADNYPNKYFDSKEAADYEKNRNKLLPQLIKGMPPPTYEYDFQKNKTGLMVPKAVPLDSAKYKLPHAGNWIEVGASSYKNNDNLKTSFSNYGKYNVDVFAPGYRINSTVPDSKYEEFDGTSMASPMVAGAAALILSYFPQLTPVQLKDILMKSVTKVTRKVNYKDEKGQTLRVNFSEICKSGGVINVYNAILLAETYK